MRMFVKGAIAIAVIATLMPAWAEDPGTHPPPNYIQIYREMVKPGKGPAHEKLEANWPKAFKSAKMNNYYVGMAAITGPSEAWFISGYPSMEAWEQETKAEEANPTLNSELNRLQGIDGDLLDSTRSVVAKYRPDLSYGANINLGAYRYFYVTTVRVKPGTAPKFVEARKMVKAAHEQAKMTDGFAIFEVVSGMPTPTYLLFIPLKSLKDVDEFPKMHESAAYKEAMGGEQGDAKMAEYAAASIMNIESSIFAFNPKMSNASPQMASADAEFWNPKPVMASTKPKPATEAKK